MNNTKLTIPTSHEQKVIVNEFVNDLKSFSYKDINGLECPVICAICDGMPQCANWYEWMDVSKLGRLCNKYHITHKAMEPYSYPPELIQQYMVHHPLLKNCLLSPKSQIMDERVIVCKSCISDLEKESHKSSTKYNPPKQSIANAYLIGDAPLVLTRLNAVELAIVSRVRIYAQCWTFFAGCHKHIKGWHTFFQNNHKSTIAQLNLLGTSTMKDNLLVVLCGPFTAKQKQLVRDAVKVNVDFIQEAIGWLINNNYHYANDTIPPESEIPVPVLLDNNQTGMSSIMYEY